MSIPAQKWPAALPWVGVAASAIAAAVILALASHALRGPGQPTEAASRPFVSAVGGSTQAAAPQESRPSAAVPPPPPPPREAAAQSSAPGESGAGQPAPQVVVSNKKMQELFDAAEAFAWKPASPEDFQTLADLAVQMTGCKQPQSPPKFGALADRLFAKIKEVSWTEEHIKAVNQYAVARITAALHGTVFVGKIVGTGSDPKKGTLLLLEVPGAAELMVVPAGEMADIRVGARVLVFGLNMGRTSQTTIPGRPQPQAIRYILSHYVKGVGP
jgi:hypothetical protein